MFVTLTDLSQLVSQRPRIAAVRWSKPIPSIYFDFINRFLFLFLLLFLLGYECYFSRTDSQCAKKIHSFRKIVNIKKWPILDNHPQNILAPTTILRSKWTFSAKYFEDDCLISAISFYWQSYQINGFFLHIDLQFVKNSAHS